MVMVDLKLFIITVFVVTLLSFIIFYILSDDKRLGIVNLLIVGIVVFLGKFIIGDWIDLILIGYVLFYQKYIKKYDGNFLVNTLLISLLMSSLSSIMTSNLMTANIFLGENKEIIFTIIELSINLAILSLFLLCYKKYNVKKFLKNNDSIFLTLSLSYMYIVILILVTFFRKLRVYDVLIGFVLLVIIFQTIFIVIFFLRDRKKRQEKYEEQLYKNQLESLKNYTEQLEKDYQSTRKFKHDYKNMLLSLRINVENQNYGELTSFLNELDNYSEKYFVNSAMEVFKDLTYIKDSYLKSIFINKLQLMLNKGINCQFECRDLIDNPMIDLVDLIRILSIFLDNGIEASLETEEKRMAIGLSKTDTGLTIIIANSYRNNQESVSKLMEQGYTSKANHSGLGLTNVQEIKNKYPNLFIQYEKEEQLFTVKILIDEGAAR